MNDRFTPPLTAFEAETRTATEHTFDTHDNVQLFYRRWPAKALEPRGAIVMFHRGHEHSGRMDHLPGELDLPDFDFFAWDARGHGRSPGARGHSPSFGTSVRDVQTFIDHIGAHHGFAPASIAVVAQSVGAVLAATWAHDYAPHIRGLVLASPAFKVKLYVPLALPGLRLLRALRGNFFVNSYVKAKLLTHDPARIASYDADPLLARAISVDVLLGLNEASERIVADAAAITLPTQLLISGSDWVVDHAPQHAFFDRLGTAHKEKHVLPGFFHDTLGERDRAEPLSHVRRFLLELFDAAPSRPDLAMAHRRGFTKVEADALALPLPALSPRGLYWSATRAGLKFGGLFSEGIRLGHETGFDSGSTLDYVYRNDARGRAPLGRLIDRVYLESIGWRGIRQRKRHVEELLRDAMRRLRARGQPVHIVDVAAGRGRYVLDAVSAGAERPDSILFRDYSEHNVRDGKALIETAKLGAIARFDNADAFDRESLANMEPRPTIGIVSGLYELFSDNDAVRTSLGGLGEAIAPGGFLVYTGQPWHPQLELIARALTSHRGGAAWVMRRRTQGEMDQLVATAGFRKVAQRIDEWGIFTVSLAERDDEASSARPWGRAAAWLLFLGPFFFATYGLATWLTAQRTGVGSIVFGWEHAVPFVPWTIVPYWAIDVIYGVSLFVCADRSELDTHAKRLLTAQVVATVSFLLFPLRFTFARPDTGGAFGDLFLLLSTFDQPFNQAPSLHIALLVILWALFARKLHGVARVLLDGTFALIGVSVMTTWQHHFIDVPTGALLGFFCLWLWPQGQPTPLSAARWTRDPRRLVLAGRYAAGASVAAAAAFIVGGAAWWLLWVSVALAFVALDYAWLGPAGFQKRDGRLSPAACVLLAPYLAGAFVNAKAWTRARSAFDHIADDVWLGRMPTPAEIERGGFAAIVDLTCELRLDPRGRAYVNLPVLDLTLPDRAVLAAAADAIERLRREGRVLVCCALGVTRSATAVAGWLVATGRARDAEAALARVREARPQIVLGEAHRARVAAMAGPAAAT